MDREQPGVSGRRLAMGIVLLGVAAAVAALLFRRLAPPPEVPTNPPATQALTVVQSTR